MPSERNENLRTVRGNGVSRPSEDPTRRDEPVNPAYGISPIVGTVLNATTLVPNPDGDPEIAAKNEEFAAEYSRDFASGAGNVVREAALYAKEALVDRDPEQPAASEPGTREAKAASRKVAPRPAKATEDTPPTAGAEGYPQS